MINKNYFIMGNIRFLSFCILMLFAAQISAQSSKDLRINEILAINDSNYQDDYGKHSPWIEIYNSAYNKVNIGGLYLTNDRKNPKKYLITKGDPITLIAPQSYLVFWADNNPTRGTLHTNFTLSETNFIALYDSDGKTLIDSFSFGPQKSNITYGRINDGKNEFGFLKKTTPNCNNNTEIKISASESFKKLDPIGVAMTMIAMSVVFLALILLYLTFKNIAKLYTIDLKKRKLIKEGKIEEAEKLSEETTGEVGAAIAMALYHYRNEFHDHENTILTIRKVAKTYSPWSSKIYGLRKMPKN